METPKTLLAAARYFADLNVCEQFMREIKWHGTQPACPHCGSLRIGEVKTRRLMRCKDCRKQFSSKVGTIFEDSPLGLDKWFVAVWAIANCKNGISSHELGRAIGVRQSTAWFMLHRIRVAIAEQVFRFNSRDLTDAKRFWLLLTHIFNKRLTYRVLAGVDDAGFMGKI
jgi:transposase-like protein